MVVVEISTCPSSICTTQIGTVIEQMRRKSMAQSMRRHGYQDARAERIFFHNHPEHDPAHGTASLAPAPGYKQVFSLPERQQAGASSGQILLDPETGDL